MDLSNDYPYYGYEVEMFWIDLLCDEMSQNRMISLDLNFKKLRELIHLTESKNVKVQFTGIQITLQYKFNNAPEEWSVSL